MIKISMLLNLLVVSICLSLINGAQELDISDVVFQDSASFVGACIQDYPSNVSLSAISATSATVNWEPLSNETDITSYQILYWEVSSSLYRNVTVGVVSQYTLTDLKPHTQYFVSVRGVCPPEGGYTVSALRQELVTRSTFPSEIPVVSEPVYNPGDLSALVTWSPISNDQWNGVMLNYVIVVADFTAKPVQQYSFFVDVDEKSLLINSLIEDHSYLVTVSANSSGGVGMASTPYWFKADGLPDPPTEAEYVNYWYYAAVPAGILLALLAILLVILCKIQYERRKRKVQFARNISTNIEEQKFPVGSDFESGMRLEPTRMSNRPLPAHPYPDTHPRTPSVSSMNARLIDQTSPNQFQRGPSFSTADHHFHHPPAPHPPPPSHMHRPDLPPLELDPNQNQFRNRSLTSPQIPQLSQPLSDLSSATPSSVFTESNVPHPEEITASSPSNPKEYEVPSDSKTCHQSVSPDITHHTLPNPRRPHTASGVMASQPALSRHPHSPHSPVSFTHSSTDIHFTHPPFTHPPVTPGNRPPDIPPHVPPHRGNVKSHAPLHHTREEFPMYSRPESGLYSEIAGEDPRFNKTVPPVDHTHLLSMDPQYNDYSDIPEIPETGGRPHLPSVGEYRNHGDILSSDSMSSFSTDSQNSSPTHSKMGGEMYHLNRINSGRSGVGMGGGRVPIPEEEGDHDYDEANSVITDNSAPVSSVNGIHSSSNSDTKDSVKANPYLSPVDLVPSSNGHTPSD